MTDKCRTNFATWIGEIILTTGKSYSSKRKMLTNIWSFRREDSPNTTTLKWNSLSFNSFCKNNASSATSIESIISDYTPGRNIFKFGKSIPAWLSSKKEVNSSMTKPFSVMPRSRRQSSKPKGSAKKYRISKHSIAKP